MGGEEVRLVKPLTFMNRSGIAVARLLEASGGAPADLVVVVDDVALELGTLRVRERGTHGGQNGLRSLIAVLGTDEFVRLRLGVRKGDLPEDLAGYVLGEFPPEDVLVVQEVVGLGADAVTCIVKYGAVETMNRFNAPGVESARWNFGPGAGVGQRATDGRGLRGADTRGGLSTPCRNTPYSAVVYTYSLLH